ncbi:hypothetical protein [Pseudovibrio sp. Tun.PSC04-5.I4]|uniref:hypothetical protein n=1 Tax=Pseudovibrio sp. Tun.PSC04-5.I4 TaxID=1798213 RepID=UPI00087F2665|nr:hypothetical protein [Pseudovibrio sp. Tun.PSC04-5.I4]SDR26314.1 hypothetical protein SAMN04515695_3901 [Pseudovibrio sp. Tun.PSC04-5.I4]
MSKSKIEVSEHRWAQKVYQVQAWKFEGYDGDPTPADVIAHCKQKNANFKKDLKKFKSQTSLLKTKEQRETFDGLYNRATVFITHADDHLKKKEIDEADNSLDDVSALLDGLGRVFQAQNSGMNDKNGSHSQNGPRNEPNTASQKIKAAEYTARLKDSKAHRKIFVVKEQRENFDQLFKQAAWVTSETDKLISKNETQTADDLLFQAESSLQGLETIIALGRQTAEEYESVKTAIQLAKSRMSEAYGLRKAITNKGKQKEFSGQHKQAKDHIKQVENLLKRGDVKGTRPVLASLSSIVEKLDAAVNIVREKEWAPLDESYNRKLKANRAEMQSYYQQINTIPDKAAKRKFEKNYATAINLVAETSDIIERDGQAAEETVKSNLTALETIITVLEDCVVNALVAATNPGNADTNQQQSTTTDRNISDLNACRAELEAAQSTLNTTLGKRGVLSDPELAHEFQQYGTAAQAYITEGLNYISGGKLQEARGKLAACTSAITSMEFSIGASQTTDPRSRQQENGGATNQIANEQKEAELRQKANAYRNILKDTRKTQKQLEAHRSKIVDPERLNEFDLLIKQINELVPIIGRTLASRQPGRIEKSEQLLPALQEASQKAKAIIDAVLAAADAKAKEPKQKKIKYKNGARGIRNNVNAREKPSGPNPEFYCEKQDGQFCLKHAMNACLGFGAISVEDMEEGLLQVNIDGFKTQTEPQTFSELKGYYPNLTLPEMRKQIAKDPEKFYRNAAKAQYETLFGTTPAEVIRTQGSEPTMGLAIVNAKQKELGLPELKDTWLEKPKTSADVQANVDKVKEITEKNGADRLVIGAGGHFIALRKNAEDEWFEVDSLADGATRINLDEYIKKQAINNKEALAILHFSEEVTYKKDKGASGQR